MAEIRAPDRSHAEAPGRGRGAAPVGFGFARETGIRFGVRWFVRGDLDGFFGLAVDNLVQLLVIHTLCLGVLGFPPELLYARVLPGVAVSLVVGNLFYAWQAKRVAAREGRSDVCALPYGINTPSVFAFVFLVMLPARLLALEAGASDAEAAEAAWRAGLVACLGSGLIELFGAFAAERVRQAAPRAALLSTLAGIALTFISLGFLFQTFGHPVVGLATLAVILVAYFGGVEIRGGLPGGLVAVALGTALAWATGLAPGPALPGAAPGAELPVPVLGALAEGLRDGTLFAYVGVILPMGLFNVIGSLQNIESAEAGGDSFATAPSLAVNGLGTLGAAAFGSCFPTTIYIGHPGWKALGARAGYSVLNAVFMTAICLTGTLAWVSRVVPVEAGMAIVLWIGIVITAQAFSATPGRHAPAVVVGLLPGVAAWGAFMAKAGLRAAGTGVPGGPGFDERSGGILEGFRAASIDMTGGFALEQGFILSAMILSAATVMVIERRFVAASLWALSGAALSAVGLLHSWKWTPGDTVIAIGWPGTVATAPWVGGYLAMAGVFLAARWITRPSPGPRP